MPTFNLRRGQKDCFVNLFCLLKVIQLIAV